MWKIFDLKILYKSQQLNLFSVATLLEISSSSRVTSSFLFVSPQPIKTEINAKLKT